MLTMSSTRSFYESLRSDCETARASAGFGTVRVGGRRLRTVQRRKCRNASSSQSRRQERSSDCGQTRGSDSEAGMSLSSGLHYGKHWNGTVGFAMDSPQRDEPYIPRHENKGHCHHWWPETGFSPPTVLVRTKRYSSNAYGNEVKDTVVAKLDKSKPAPFRMRAREAWQVPSQKGFQPGSVAQFKYPIDEFWAGDSAIYAEFVLLNRWDYPGVTSEVDSVESVKNGPQIAWRVKWIRQHYSNGAFGNATGAEFRIPEWRLQPIMLVLDAATGKVGRLLGDEEKGNWYGTRIPDYLIPGEWSGS
ncbi:gp89 [Mycobacterium phage Predator]|uniref:Uncharacterized protein n=1 Tax=Mycobacterium phage Predator TaxID=543153 RepID=B3VMB6_9CAUD|nr:gp89 [Mycobacterium phage Predator]ACF05186.1 hypothetical protein PREDATOR_89 [Mycobacterium phage Predator]